jgi:hypothetical protein
VTEARVFAACCSMNFKSVLISRIVIDDAFAGAANAMTSDVERANRWRTGFLPISGD